MSITFTISTNDREDYDVFAELGLTLNISQRNFFTFTSALGLDLDCCGTMEPQELVRYLDKLNPQLSVRNMEVKNGPITIIDCGISEEQVYHYCNTLRNICVEATRHHRKVQWC
jgi:hypothetical protein